MSAIPRMLLTGAGLVSSRLIGSGLADEIYFTSLRGCLLANCIPLELTEADKFDYGFIRPGDYVVHLAALSLPDQVAKNPKLARAINVTGTIRFMRGCLERGARVVFFSSDMVYGPSLDDSAFDEDSPLNPMAPYETMKAEVEEAMLGEPGFKVLRPSYMGSLDDKYTKTLAEYATSGKTAEPFRNMLRTVIHLDDAVRAVGRLYLQWDKTEARVINLCGPKLISRADMVAAYQKVVAPELTSVASDAPEGFFDNRPKVLRVRSKYLEKLLGRPPLDYETALKVEFKERNNGS